MRADRVFPGVLVVGVLIAGTIAGVLASATSVAAAEAGQIDREARLEEALGDYAAALGESERDARLAGFARAERGFASLAADGVETAALFTNLGNAALQARHPGRAVLAYHRALRLDPESRAALQNLAHIRGGLPSWVPRPDATDDLRAVFDDRRIPIATRSLLAASGFLLATLCLAISVRRQEGAFRGLAGLFTVVFLLSLASVFFRGELQSDRLAVLVAEEVPARSADSALAPLALPEPLPAGVEVDLLEGRGEWARIRLANGRDVWVLRSSVERVVD